MDIVDMSCKKNSSLTKMQECMYARLVIWPFEKPGMGFLESEYFKEKSKEGYKIAAKNSELKTQTRV